MSRTPIYDVKPLIEKAVKLRNDQLDLERLVSEGGHSWSGKDTDTVLATIENLAAGEEIAGIGVEALDLFLNAHSPREVAVAFETFIGTSFESFLGEAQKVVDKELAKLKPGQVPMRPVTVTFQAMVTYDTSILVPDNLTPQETYEYILAHEADAPRTKDLHVVDDSDQLDCEALRKHLGLQED